MRIIDLSTIRNEDGKIPFGVWLRRSFSEGFGWRTDLDAQDQVIPILERVLGKEFTLIREVRLPGLETPIPMVLLGPPGIYVIHATGIKGTYRARGDSWLVLDTSGNMHNAHPNLPTRARLYAEAVRKFLAQNDFAQIEIEPVLMFSRPEAFVENIKSPIRIVMCDGLESYTGSLRLLNPVYSPMECSAMVNLLANPEGKFGAFAEKAEEEEILPQPVIQPSDMMMPEGAEGAEEGGLMLQSTLGELEYPEYEDLHFSGEAEELEEESFPEVRRSRFSLYALLASTNMNTRQITLLGVFALLDLVTICALLAFVLLTMAR